MERDAFLARVRAATSTAQLPPHPAEDPGLLVPDLPEVDLVELFAAQVLATEGVLHRVSTNDEVRRRVAEIAESQESRSFMIWDDDEMGVPGIGPVLAAAGLEEMSGGVDGSDRLAHQMGYVGLDLGITSAEAGFAESGTVVVRSGPGRPRMASLIPLVHVVLLPVDRLHRSLAHWARDHASGIQEAANVVFITGPSKTGDIEQHINVGVHGPRYVHVLLIG